MAATGHVLRTVILGCRDRGREHIYVLDSLAMIATSLSAPYLAEL